LSYSSQIPKALQPSTVTKWASRVVLALGGIWILVPIVWLLYTSVKLPVDGFAFPPKIFSPFTLANFRTLVSNGYFGAVVHSLVVTTSCVVSALVLGLPAGYALSRGRFRGRQVIGIFLLASYAAPAVIFIIPLYFIYTKINILDSYPSLVLAYLTGLLPFTIWLSRRFFDDIPTEIEEAAVIDGCSHAKVFMRIVLPLSRPAITTTGVLVALLAWGEFFGALILTGPSTVTAPVVMANFISYNTTDWSALAAAGVVMIVPVLVATIIGQRGLLSGLTSGGVRE
jgi:multiple sugar transport system permease protein